MNRMAARAAAFAVLLLIGRGVCAEQLSVLKHVRSDVRGGECRVTFAFEGDVRFSSEQTGRSLRLVFPQTRPATAGTIVRKDFSSGPVHSITFTRSADGSLVATLTLGNGSSYRCVSPAGGQDLYVDVHGETGGRSAVTASTGPKENHAAGAAGRAVELSAGGLSESMHAADINPNANPPVKVSLIDIPALAMSQVETESPETSPVVASPSETTQASGLSAGIALLISLFVSLASTATALSAWYLIR